MNADATHPVLLRFARAMSLGSWIVRLAPCLALACPALQAQDGCGSGLWVSVESQTVQTTRAKFGEPTSCSETLYLSQSFHVRDFYG